MTAITDAFINAARRAKNTGLPLDYMLRSEVARRRHQIEKDQIPADQVVRLDSDQGVNHQMETYAGIAEQAGLTTPDEIRERTPEVAAEKKRADDKAKRKSPSSKKDQAQPGDVQINPTGKRDVEAKTETVPSAADAAPPPEGSSTLPAEIPSTPAPSAEEIVAINKKRGNIGKAVTYIDPFKKERTGTIAHVIPSNTLPSTLGIAAKGAKVRDHISYVVETDKGGLVWPASTATDIGMKLVPVAG